MPLLLPPQARCVIVWEFRVRPGCESRFEQAYGPGGVWAQFFAGGEGYVGTELVRDRKEPRRYLTLDAWSSRAAYETFRERHRSDYAGIDAECEQMTESEVEVGTFQRLGS